MPSLLAQAGAGTYIRDSMNWLEAVTKIIEALAWPCVVVSAGATFRTPLINLLNRIKSVKAGGAEFEMYEEQIMAAAGEVAIQAEKLQSEQPLPESERKTTADALNAATAELTSLLAERRILAGQLESSGLTPGRAHILRMVVEAIGPEYALALTAQQLQEQWPQLARTGGVNAGAMLGLRSVGILDGQNRLKNIGAMLIHSVAREIIARRNLR